MFLITSTLFLVSTVLFLFFGSTDIQPWNNKIKTEPEKTPEKEDLIMVKIKIPIKEEHTNNKWSILALNTNVY